ncbi:MAG: LysM peptidoglycan-binding domain-containing protein [Vulcanococcus sp.]
MRRSAAALALALLLPLPALAGEVTVKPGETLSEIAERYGTSVERLMQLNGLRSPQDLWAGSRIQVPGAGGSSGRGGAGTGAGNYTVKSGETLSEIAERYGTSVERLMQLNGLRTAQDLWAGSRIQVPGASPARPSGASRASAPVNRNAREHQVQRGETLSEIADRYGIPMGRLVSLNNLSKPNDLQAGTTLKLRQPSPTTKPAAKATASRPPARPRPTAVASKPAAKPTPKPAASPAAATTTAATTTAAAPSKPTPSSSAKPTATASASASPVTPASTAAVTPAATPAKPATSPAAKPAAASPATSTASAKPSKPANPDWRSYGPLQVDWANWQPMAGSYVAPSLNSEGQPLYLAINCSARRLNATGQSGTWKTWDAPQSDFEEQLISDLCKTKGS